MGWKKELDYRLKIRQLIIFFSSVLLMFVIALSLPVISTALIARQTRSNIQTDFDSILLSAENGRSAISFMNSILKPSDLVVTSPSIAWGIESRATDFQLTLAYSGKKTKHFPLDIPRNRFDYPLDYQSATYIVIDPVWRNWAIPNMVEVKKMTEQVQRWPLIYYNNQVEIYRNPEIK